MHGTYLKKNHACMMPRYICFLDTETMPEPITGQTNRVAHKFRLGVAIAGRYENGQLTRCRTLHFTSPETFWNWFLKLCGPRHTTWLVAHNLLFDLIPLNFVDMFFDKRLVLDKPRSPRPQDKANGKPERFFKLAVLNDPPTIIGLRENGTGNRFVAVDSFNWFKASIKTLGDSVDLPKLEMPDFDLPNHRWFRYCQRDTEILAKTFVRYLGFLETHDLGNCKWTVAGQAYASFRHRFMSHDILMHDNFAIKDIERASYFGGRWECWRLGSITGGCWHLDVNSLFPSVMIGNEYPVRPIRWALNRGWKQYELPFDPYKTIAHCTIRTTEPLYPYRQSLGVVYPIGEFRTVLAGPELAMAIEKGHCYKTAQFVEYETAQIFNRYVEYFWKLRRKYRLEGNKVYADLCKLFLNSLYGKFGQKSENWVDVPDQIAPDCFTKWQEVFLQTGETVEFRSIGYDVQRLSTDRERKESFPAISSFVTAYARMKMNDLRDIAWQPNVYYQGVDSLIVNNAGYHALLFDGKINREELGALKVEHSSATCRISGLGDYEIGDYKARVGVKQNAVELPNGNVSEMVFRTGENLFAMERLNHIECETVEKQRRKTYDKGVIDSEGYISPLVLGKDCPF